MYYVWQRKTISWRNHTLYAKLQGQRPTFQPHWWDCEPLFPPLPTLTFAISRHGPKPDVYNTGTLIDLYSHRLVAILQKKDVKFESFPTIIVDYKTGEEIVVNYAVFHLLEMHPALDMEHSIINEIGIEKLVITEECLQAAYSLFRVKEAANLVLIHDDLKCLFEEEGITGCEYNPTERFRLP